jgi:hypothetical protein
MAALPKVWAAEFGMVLTKSKGRGGRISDINDNLVHHAVYEKILLKCKVWNWL